MSAVHVMPTNDIQEHEESLLCWCKPKLVEENLIFHNVFSDAYPIEERDIQ